VTSGRGLQAVVCANPRPSPASRRISREPVLRAASQLWGLTLGDGLRPLHAVPPAMTANLRRWSDKCLAPLLRKKHGTRAVWSAGRKPRDRSHPASEMRAGRVGATPGTPALARARAESLLGGAAEADTPTIAAGIGPPVVPSSTSAMTSGRAAELAGRQGDRGRSLFTFRDG
jgi:hypothetical protein